jgi:hypothetical protein
MIILGYRTRVKEVGRGRFLCPHCQVMQTYRRRRTATYFTAYFIPLFPIGLGEESVQCQGCLKAWRSEVLRVTPASREERFLDHGRRAARREVAAAKPEAPPCVRVDYRPVIDQQSHSSD